MDEQVTDEEVKSWWKEWPLPAGAGAAWEIGPLALQVYHAPGEWVIAHQPREVSDARDKGWSVRETKRRPRGIDYERFVPGPVKDCIVLRPRVADRSVVARPRLPVHVLSGEETTIYVSSPIWVEIATCSPDRALIRVPTQRMSDTWFGSTRDGELAYSLRTLARSSLDDVPRRSYRAITPVVLRNGSGETLQVDRMNLPVPYLSVFGTPHAHLWTERVTLTRRHDSEYAVLETDSGPPVEARDASRLSGPHRERSSGSLVRAFSSLLRPFQTED